MSGYLVFCVCVFTGCVWVCMGVGVCSTPHTQPNPGAPQKREGRYGKKNLDPFFTNNSTAPEKQNRKYVQHKNVPIKLLTSWKFWNLKIIGDDMGKEIKRNPILFFLKNCF